MISVYLCPVTSQQQNSSGMCIINRESVHMTETEHIAETLDVEMEFHMILSSIPTSTPLGSPDKTLGETTLRPDMCQTENDTDPLSDIDASPPTSPLPAHNAQADASTQIAPGVTNPRKRMKEENAAKEQKVEVNEESVKEYESMKLVGTDGEVECHLSKPKLKRICS
uniref:Elf-1_N domain-containing protein n=1 Tax=Mesocestoides corti TaxID=53468 RepID=A0A5K3G053_MESCO